MATGTASLGGGDGASREREAARLTPALYHLLPSFAGAIASAPGLPNDLYAVGTWQPSVLETLAEFIRLHGLRKGSKGDRLRWAGDLLASMLSTAKAHRERVESLTLARAGLTADDWLCLVGVDATTRVQLDIDRDGGKPVFDLTGEHRVNNWGGTDPAQRVQTGDGTVPYLGAEPAFLERRNLVCLRPDDFGYWEVADRAVLQVAGFHGMLPTLNLAHRLVVSHLRGAPTKGLWGRPAPGVSTQDWAPPIRGLDAKV